MHPSHWFENGICVLGQNLGVIAAGLMLLKMVDPEASDAAFQFDSNKCGSFSSFGEPGYAVCRVYLN
jgi:hypothetical protein